MTMDAGERFAAKASMTMIFLLVSRDEVAATTSKWMSMQLGWISSVYMLIQNCIYNLYCPPPLKGTASTQQMMKVQNLMLQWILYHSFSEYYLMSIIFAHGFFLIEDEVYLHTYVISCIKIGIDFNPGLFWFYERRWKVKNKQEGGKWKTSRTIFNMIIFKSISQEILTWKKIHRN